MASTISICNSALRKIGANVITSLDQNTEEAKACKGAFSDALDTLLMGYPWNFAMCRTSLAKLDSTPSWGFDYEYQLPTDPYCLVVRKAVDTDETKVTKKIEGRKLLTDTDGVWIQYTKRVTDMNELSALFKQALVFYLGSDLAITLAEDNSFSNTLYQKHELALGRAQGQDAREDTPDEIPEGSWVTCRY